MSKFLPFGEALAVAAALLLGQTPAMAWSSWNFFAFGINETIALEIGDALVETGLAKLGYEYVNIDAGSFTGDRDSATGKIIPNAAKYPHGMRWLSDQLHAKGLKFGVYTDISNHTCGGSGSMGHYKIDAETYAHDWQIVGLRCGLCCPLCLCLCLCLCLSLSLSISLSLCRVSRSPWLTNCGGLRGPRLLLPAGLSQSRLLRGHVRPY